MRKIIIALLSIAAITLLILIIIRAIKKDSIEIQVLYVDDFETVEVETINFCAIDQYDNFNLIKVEVPVYEENIYKYIFELYNQKRNTLPIDYKVVSNDLLFLNEIKKTGSKIEIDILENDMDTNELKRFINALNISYKQIGITKVILTINHEPLN